MIIAIDGPAASGKGTLAKRIASHFGLTYLDTGLIYRTIAAKVLQSGADPNNEAAVLGAARSLDLNALPPEKILRSAPTGEAASIVAAYPAVRSAILDVQRDFAAQAPGAVLDGRDIGTVVCPDADVKLFVTASLEVRARRRQEELKRAGVTFSQSEMEQQLSLRDQRDKDRAVAPLTAASDAHLLDTSELDIEAAFQAAIIFIDGRT